MYALDPSKNTAWRRTCFVCLIPKGGKQGHDNYICCMQIDGFLMQTHCMICFPCRLWEFVHGHSFCFCRSLYNGFPLTRNFSVQVIYPNQYVIFPFYWISLDNGFPCAMNLARIINYKGCHIISDFTLQGITLYEGFPFEFAFLCKWFPLITNFPLCGKFDL